jgi:hypothetical protein
MINGITTDTDKELFKWCYAGALLEFANFLLESAK